jgi:hypothetical protein
MATLRHPAVATLAAPVVPGLLESVAQLTNADILALNAAPQTLVAAPGAGFAVAVDSVYFYFASAGAYTVGSADMKVEYATGADILDIVESGFLNQGTDQARHYAPAVGAFTPVANSAVRLICEAAALTGGNAANTLSIRTLYRLVPMNAFA